MSWGELTPARVAHELHDETLMLTMARQLDAKRAMRAAGMATLLACLLAAIAKPSPDAAQRLGDAIATLDRCHPRADG